MSIARSQSFNTPRLLVESGLAYMADWVNDELPYRFATGAGDIVEIQATGEKRGFSRAEFDRLFELAHGGCAELFALQRAALEAR